MSKKRIVIKNGEVCGFANEVSFKGLDVQGYSKKRVSRIVPTNGFLMIAFYVIRGLCSDESKVAAWTRVWRCQWKVLIDGKEIGIYLIDGEYYALEDVCPHAYALLSQGFVEDGKVECPLHEAVFDVKTGQCLHGPGGRNLNRYPVRVYDNQIQITFIEENVA